MRLKLGMKVERGNQGHNAKGKIIQALHETYGIGQGLTRLPHLDETIEDLQETVLK